MWKVSDYGSIFSQFLSSSWHHAKEILPLLINIYNYTYIYTHGGTQNLRIYTFTQSKSSIQLVTCTIAFFLLE